MATYRALFNGREDVFAKRWESKKTGAGRSALRAQSPSRHAVVLWGIASLVA